MPKHLRPSAPTAPDALLCGDPARALMIAQAVLVKPRMSNHHRGLWGYHGRTHAGRDLTVQATGIGAPSTAVVLDELAALGLRRAIRVGTCRAPGPAPHLGEAGVVVAALAYDGTSTALGWPRGEAIRGDVTLTEALRAGREWQDFTVCSRDLHSDSEAPSSSDADAVRAGALVEDLQTAGLFAICRRRKVAAAAVLAVARAGGRPLEDEPLEVVLLALARAATVALQRSPSG